MRPPTPTSPSVIDLTTQVELAAVSQQVHHEENIRRQQPQDEDETDFEEDQENIVMTQQYPAQPSTSAAVAVQTADIASQTVELVTRDFGLQANPFQDEFMRLSTVLKYSYVQFLRFEKDERLFNNHVELPMIQPTRHTQVMSKIDAYFLGNSNEVDPDIIVYLTELRSNIVVPQNRFDRIRTHLMNLEIEHKIVEHEHRRLRQCELGDRTKQKRMVCSVCFTDIVPGLKLLFGGCMHLICRSCTMEILRNPNLSNRCGVCRDVIGADTCRKTHFKFNNRKEPVCRQCWKPFNDDGSIIKMIGCGHTFHETCMQSKCMQCGFENVSEDASKILHVRWNNF